MWRGMPGIDREADEDQGDVARVGGTFLDAVFPISRSIPECAATGNLSRKRSKNMERRSMCVSDPTLVYVGAFAQWCHWPVHT